MISSKRISLALAALVVLGATSVFAQGPAFQSTSLPRQMRGEGLTETAGEIFLLVTNPSATTTILAGSSINIVYSGTITGTATAPINNITCTLGGVSTVGCPLGLITATVSGNQFTISFNAAAVFSAPVDGIAITGIRVNASAAVPGPVTASLSGSSPLPIVNPITFTQPSLVVGIIVNPSLAATFPKTPLAILTCAAPTKSAATINTTVTVQEAFPAAWTILAQEVFNTPAGPPITNGSQLDIIVSGVPAGYTVTPIAPTAITGAGAPPLVGFGALPGAVDQTTAGADIVFTFTFAATNTAVVEGAVMNFNIGTTSSSGVAAGGLNGNITARVRQSPITTTTTTVVRFTDSSTISGTIATVSDCVTRLLFPWVANVVDLDTGIAVANTSEDDVAFGTGTANGAGAQTGTCVLTLYPQAGGTPASFTTPSVAAGQTTTLTLSGTTSFSGKAGYILAKCNFLNAHAFAFITNGFGTATGATVAQGYVANVVPLGQRPALPVVTNESLGN